MQHRISRSVASLIAVAASAAGFASLAQAQVGPMDPSQMLKHQAEQAPDMTKPHVVPPPALPGATSSADSVAPATRIPSDMSPNDALFDAINRGDIAAARDALSRGADLNAQNLLGMTPMELSVDLGRNDISFLLLSYRGMDGSPSAGQAQAATQAATPAPAPRKAAAKSRARASVMPVKEVAPAPPQAPRLFANDGGAPVPGAGFLGFDAGRSER
jgi:ankyrin repeat protein